MTIKTTSSRRYDLDWLRVLVILAVFVFHSLRFFDQMPWHVKSASVYFGVQAWTMFMLSWLMPLVFVISGASLFHAVDRGSAVSFIHDKVLRLLVPFLAGVFSHVAFCVYLERVSHHQFVGSFIAFYPHYFDGMYGYGGNFAWMGLHLWYLQMLFVFTLVCFPIFRLLKGAGRGLLDALGNFLTMPGVILILALPVILLSHLLDPRTFLGLRSWGGWSFPAYIFYLFYGFIIFSHSGLQTHIRKTCVIYLTGALVTAAILYWQFGYVRPGHGTPGSYWFDVLFGVSSWCWILAFIGYAIKHLTHGGPFLKYANETVLPFYIMHQTVLLVFGFYILPWQIPDIAKWLLIAIASFTTVIGLHEYAVRRLNILRFLFGMKALSGGDKLKTVDKIGQILTP